MKIKISSIIDEEVNKQLLEYKERVGSTTSKAIEDLIKAGLDSTRIDGTDIGAELIKLACTVKKIILLAQRDRLIVSKGVKNEENSNR